LGVAAVGGWAPTGTMRGMNPLEGPLASWYGAMARDLPWRAADTTPWGVFVSEIMLQQTPGARVIPYYLDWLARWPTPYDLGRATPAEAILAWGTLGYPRRALRLRECGEIIGAEYGNVVPSDEGTLRGLPGVGEYTAAAVAAFAYGQRTVVLDTNIRRVIARAWVGAAGAPPSLTQAERTVAAELLPATASAAVMWNAATMELGAVICRVRSPECDRCPVRELCAWRAAGYPGDPYADRRRTQPFEGTNRQRRGQIMAVLRTADGELVPIAALVQRWPGDGTVAALNGLVADGLAVREGAAVRLP